MSRHRSPGGRNAHPQPVVRAGALAGAQPVPQPARHRAATHTAVRNGMTAAAAAGGALAVVVPTVAVATGPATGAVAEEAPVLRLTADGASVSGVRMIASVAPVAGVREPEPPEVDVAELLKAAGLAEIARKAEEERLAREAAARCAADLGDLGRVKPWVRDAARFLSCLYGHPPLIGVAQRNRDSDHPSGHALDLMVRGERGDRIAECALANQEELGITYVIWEQRVNYGDGWERMEDRGNDTENHFDHVHISFGRSAPDDIPRAERCE
ncbi:hypothetical protein [Pseudonocardia nigra]|uniref:hypothetical protein n=1 Tax=Pseudonocardia nigra TaxID=1921578 RepID=UPI001C5F9EB4|nr:hypothetical protein [Pseudonocardia nigra]